MTCCCGGGKLVGCIVQFIDCDGTKRNGYVVYNLGDVVTISYELVTGPFWNRSSTTEFASRRVEEITVVRWNNRCMLQHADHCGS